MEESKKIKRFFISYSSKDKEFVDRFVGALSYKKGDKPLLDCLEVIIDHTFLFTGAKIENEVFTDEIDKSDGFIFIISNAFIKSDWANGVEYKHAKKIKDENPNFLFIPILIEDLNEKSTFNLNEYKYSDFRSIRSFSRDVDTLISKSLCSNISESIRHEVTYNNEILPNLENIRQSNLTRSVVEEALEKYVAPLKEEIHRMTKNQQAHERIMTIEAIAEKEQTANDNIWIVSTHLNNDINDEEIKESVRSNQRKSPHIEYTYFVPMDSSLINKRIEAYKKFHSEENEGKTYKFIKIDKEEALMPFAELVIYDPDDSSIPKTN